MELARVRRKLLVVKSNVFAILMLLAVLSAAQKTPIQRTPKFQWEQGEPQELDKALADCDNISTGDRAALLSALAREYNNYPTPPSPMERAERTHVKFIDLNGDGVSEVIAQPIGDICGAANCPLFVFQKTGTNYRVILKKRAAQYVTVQKTRTNGYLDVVVGMHGSATEEGLFVYQFSSRRYRQTHCYNESLTELGRDGEVHELEKPRITPCQQQIDVISPTTLRPTFFLFPILIPGRELTAPARMLY